MEIPLHSGGNWSKPGPVVAHAQIDPEDFSEISKFRWRLSPYGYAVRTTQPATPSVCPECGWEPPSDVHVAHSVASHRGRKHGPPPRQKRHSVPMHRQILGLAVGDPRQGDHRNRDRTDNRRSNLRIVAAGQQPQNQGSPLLINGKPPESPFRGVYKVKKKGVWRGVWKAVVNQHYLGCFDDEAAAAEAARAYRLATMPMALD